MVTADKAAARCFISSSKKKCSTSAASQLFGGKVIEILMRQNSLSAASSFTTPITGSPSTGTLYEVQPQQLPLHHGHNFQE